jgi:hypothetical protein
MMPSDGDGDGVAVGDGVGDAVTTGVAAGVGDGVGRVATGAHALAISSATRTLLTGLP